MATPSNGKTGNTSDNQIPLGIRTRVIRERRSRPRPPRLSDPRPACDGRDNSVSSRTSLVDSTIRSGPPEPINDEGLAEVEAANPFVYPDFTQELVDRVVCDEHNPRGCVRFAVSFLTRASWAP